MPSSVRSQYDELFDLKFELIEIEDFESMMNSSETIHIILKSHDKLRGFCSFRTHVGDVNNFAELFFITVEIEDEYHGSALLMEFERLCVKYRVCEAYIYASKDALPWFIHKKYFKVLMKNVPKIIARELTKM
jgi:hypothetical protein